MGNIFKRLNTMPIVKKVIREDIEKYVKIMKVFYVLFSITVALSFFSCALGDKYDNPIFFMIPFFGFGLSGFLSQFFMMRAFIGKEIVSLKKQIENEERIELSNLKYKYANYKGDILYIVQLMIERNVLPEYEIIGNNEVSKKYLHEKSNEIKNEPKTMLGDTDVLCPYCGNQVKAVDIYCSKCGRRL